MKPTAALFAGVFLAAGLLAGCGQPGPSLSAPADSAPEAVEAVSPAQAAADQAAALIDAVKAAGYTKVVLRPLMVVAGDHAWNDMSGDEPDSWKSLFTAAGFAVETQMTGLGSVPGVQQLYVDHTGAAMAAL